MSSIFELEGPECTADGLFTKFGLAIGGAFDDEGFKIGKTVFGKHNPASDAWGMQENYQFSVRVHLPGRRTEVLWYISWAPDRSFRWSLDEVVTKIGEFCADITRNVPEVVAAIRENRPARGHGIATPIFYEPNNPHPDESILGVLWKCERLP